MLLSLIFASLNNIASSQVIFRYSTITADVCFYLLEVES